MKIRAVDLNNRKQAFEVKARGRSWAFPFARAEPAPSRDDRVESLFVDPELGREGFTYVLESGAEGSVLMDQVLEYHRDPGMLRELLLHRLTVEARRRIDASGLGRREVCRRLGTSPAQLQRLLDPTNRRKSLDAMVSLLEVLGCEVDLTVRAAGSAALRPGT